MFPIGALQKSRVRELAQKAGLPTASKKGLYRHMLYWGKEFFRFIGQYIKKSVGNMVDIDSGKVMAQHEGLFHYTIGQRKGSVLEEVEAGSLGLWPKRSSHRHSVYLSGEKSSGVVQQRAYSR